MKDMLEKFDRWTDTLIAKAKFPKRPPEDPAAPRYADLNDRALAAALDVLLLYLLLFSFFMWMQGHIYAQIDGELLRQAGALSQSDPRAAAVLLWQSGQPQWWLTNALIQFTLIGALVVAIQVQFGTTPGKRLMGIKVVDAVSHQPAKPWQYVLRFVGYLVACLPLMIGIFWISFNKKRRGWHDYLAHTVVLHTRPRGWYWQQIKRGYFWLKQRL